MMVWTVRIVKKTARIMRQLIRLFQICTGEDTSIFLKKEFFTVFFSAYANVSEVMDLETCAIGDEFSQQSKGLIQYCPPDAPRMCFIIHMNMGVRAGFSQLTPDDSARKVKRSLKFLYYV
jgi:hypothetical protein